MQTAVFQELQHPYGYRKVGLSIDIERFAIFQKYCNMETFDIYHDDAIRYDISISTRYRHSRYRQSTPISRGGSRNL